TCRTLTAKPGECTPKTCKKEATKMAIEVGYRHIDCAFIYGNEVEVGRAIRARIADGTVKREDIFYTGKLWSTFQSPELVRPALERTLKDLGLDYVDLFIIHTPVELKLGVLPKDTYWRCSCRDRTHVPQALYTLPLLHLISVINASAGIILFFILTFCSEYII
uniref:NADP-dependent oxidoreductase domain-containing protein n=1 Tax=Leptobrachium leishanense TaxID=445787 RepID=A0A8C5WKS7_9ANUR